MSFAIDIVVIAILAITILLGYKNGLVKSLISLLGGIIALVLAFTFSTALGNIISENVIRPPIQSMVTNAINDKVDVTALENATKSDAIASIVSTIEKIDLKIFNLEEQKTDIINSIKNASTTQTIKQSLEDVAVSIATPMANAIGRIIAFIIILIVVNIAFFILKLIFSFVDKLPILKQFNRLGGLIIGIMHGVLLVFIVLSILKFAMPTLQKSYSGDISEQTINKTIITKIFYNNNPIKF